MNELLLKMQNDPNYMLTATVVLVVLLFIVLLIVVTSMRVKSYKDRYINTRIDNEEKDNLLAELQESLQSEKIKNAKQQQELHLFSHTKEKLLHEEESHSKLQKEFNALTKLQSQTEAKLLHTEEKLSSLTDTHQQLTERFEAIQEENSKLHINNARLLIKLETEARIAMEKKQRRKNEKREEKQ